MDTDYVDKLPLANTPEVFGLHPNAEIGYYTEAVKDMLNHLIELQPQTGMNTNVVVSKNTKETGSRKSQFTLF